MYLFASLVRWGTSELTLIKKTVRSSGMPPDADTALGLLLEVLHEYQERSKNQYH